LAPEPLEDALRNLAGHPRWAWPEQMTEADPLAGAATEACLALCSNVAACLTDSAASPARAAGALQALRKWLGPERTVALRVDEVLSVEAGCILAKGQVASAQGMAAVAALIEAVLKLEEGHAEYRSDEAETTAAEEPFNARSFGTLLLPTLLECTLAGITKCWDCDWSVLSRQLQPLHDLVLKQPLLDHAAMALLQLIWLRAPTLLPEEAALQPVRSPPFPQCIYGLACISQEIHDTLVAAGLADTKREEIQLMAHARREVLRHLGQASRWQPSAPATPPTSPTKKRPAAASPKSGAKRPRALKEAPSPQPVQKPTHLASLEQSQDVQSLLVSLVERFGCEALVASFMERVEKAMAVIALSALAGHAKKANEATEAGKAAEKLADLLKYFQLLIGFGKDAELVVAAQLPQFVRHLLATSSWPDCWRHELGGMLELVILPPLAPKTAAALWSQVGEKWLEHANASRLTAVGSLASVLNGVLDAGAPERKNMQHLRHSAVSCLLCFHQVDPRKTHDKLEFGEATSAEEEEGPSSSRARCSDELSEASEEIGSNDTESPSSNDDDGASDLESFEDDRAEFNDCGFLSRTGNSKRFASRGSAPAASDQSEAHLRYRSNLVPDWKERVREIIRQMPKTDDAEEEPNFMEEVPVKGKLFEEEPLPPPKDKLMEESDSPAKKLQQAALLDEPGACSTAVL